ncbi:hypothetical protein COHA_009278 [Chlorella ohadii]|uniref:Uncharacterized protein n=1 Tax=Chlorella ohadii TaxID=2649997 RepID=A0AAD5DIB9_9CHLO|nr:hypothetical protein COHA_009278 [Chlorella ohadii]
MTSLLKRLSITKARLEDAGVPSSASARLTSSTSFSDFSMGAHQDADDHHAPAPLAAAPADACPPSPSVLATSAPAAGYGFSGLAESAALRIPRASMAHILEQRLFANGNGALQQEAAVAACAARNRSKTAGAAGQLGSWGGSCGSRLCHV